MTAPSADAERSKEWRCFHCDEVFTNWGHARNHFGFTPEDGAPACRVEHGVASRLYHLNRRVLALQQQISEEDGPLQRQIAGMELRHRLELQREEEKGYARGLADGRALREEFS